VATPGAGWKNVRLHVVTGKGGTGKTTVAAALALALAAGGRKTLLVETEGRQGIARLFDSPPLPFEEIKISVAPGGGDVYGLPIDAEPAMLEYMEMFYRLGRSAGKAMKKAGVIDFATTVAPGVRDVLVTGKTYEAVRRTERGRPVYDAVVMDAPPTGRVVRFLNVHNEMAGLARMGPIHNQAESVARLLHSPQTAVHLVTLLEEMPVQETADAIEDLQASNLPVGCVLVNMIRPPFLSQEGLAAAASGSLAGKKIATGLHAAGLDARQTTIDALASEAAEHAERIALEQEQRKVLGDLNLPIYELPFLSEGVDLGGLYRLAQTLQAQGVA
jgi:anion-transporting  ArsA/GET3 family ATPase